MAAMQLLDGGCCKTRKKKKKAEEEEEEEEEEEGVWLSIPVLPAGGGCDRAGKTYLKPKLWL